MLTVQEITQHFEVQGEAVTIVAADSKKEIELNAYLLNRLLAYVKGITAYNQMKITVSEKDFEGIQAMFGH
ncbi:MAG: hypothetical protein ACI4TK_07680 [Agathobacter sp.]